LSHEVEGVRGLPTGIEPHYRDGAAMHVGFQSYQTATVFAPIWCRNNYFLPGFQSHNRF
jgi:hypothetical protein